MNTADSAEVLRLHALWVDGDPGGERANLQDADLQGADLQGANLQGADLRGANLQGADLQGTKGADDIPHAPVPGLAAKVAAQLRAHPETWAQWAWHSDCGTAHCCAGWAVVLAGDVGKAAERRIGSRWAGALLLGGDDHPFGVDDKERVLPWLDALAAKGGE